jgi:flagellar motor switch/type III secretory pathway protein FliN
MNQPTNTENSTQFPNIQQEIMDTSLFESIISENTSALTSTSIENNNSSSLQLRSERELNFDIFSKVIGLEIWGESATLLLSHWPIPNAIEKFLPEKELLTIPKELALITLSTVYDDVLTELSQILSTDINLNLYLLYNDKVFNDNKELYHKNSIPFTITLEDAVVVEACLLVDEKTMGKFSPFIGQISASKVISLHQVIAPLYLEYGRSYLTLSEMKSIETGDILMMDHYIETNTIRLRFSTNRTFLAKKQADISSYEIIEVFPNGDNAMKLGSSDSSQLQLSFDCGKTIISLDEIEKIGLGYSLDIPENLNQGILIRFNNQEVGEGDVVKIGKRVGLRITRLVINE